jgi:hypothetical protein
MIYSLFSFRCQAPGLAQPSQQPATKNVCKTRGCNYSFWAPDDGRCVARKCWAIKKHWNKKFYYMVASCWFFLWVLYYVARIHEHQILNYISKRSTFWVSVVFCTGTEYGVGACMHTPTHTRTRACTRTHY